MHRTLDTIRRRLNALLASHGNDQAAAESLRLHPDAARALCFVSQPSTRYRRWEGHVFELGFSDACPGLFLPRVLHASIEGIRVRVPVLSVRSETHGEAHSWVRARNQPHGIVTGTLGAILRSTGNPSRLLALTAGHVLGSGPGSVQGDAVEFRFDREATPGFMGRLFDWKPNFAIPGGGTDIDAAIADVSADAVEVFVQRRAQWPVGCNMALEGDELVLHTQHQQVHGVALENIVSCRLRVNGDDSLIYTIVDALGWRADSTPAGGDSGAPVWNATDELVAIHAGIPPAGNRSNAVAIPIAPILFWAKADIVRRDEALRRSAIPTAVAPPLEVRGGEPSAAGPAAPAPAVSPVPAGAVSVSQECDTLARTMWGEARGEPDAEAGMKAVACVVLNRVARKTYWGKTVETVCRKPYQFSCWNANDPNLPRLLAVGQSDSIFRQALRIAGELLAVTREEQIRVDVLLTNGATHYYAWRTSRPPRWAAGHEPCARIGGHVFFNDIP